MVHEITSQSRQKGEPRERRTPGNELVVAQEAKEHRRSQRSLGQLGLR